MKRIILSLIFINQLVFAQAPPKPYGALPTKRQLAWHEVEMYGLVHFTPTTFENKEWGYGDADPKTFNPTDFNATQIVKAAKAGGLKGIILVAKHHDGFALWPTSTTAYNISKSPFRDGKGDLVKEMRLAAQKYGLKFGVYCSPWDRNNASYGTPAYLEVYRAQLKELYTNYGELFMSWHDGANGGDGYYGGAKERRSIDRGTYYHWDETWNNLTRKLQPMANIFSDVGWDVRWAGSEDGFVAETSWATITPEPPKGMNNAVPGQSNYEINPTGTRNGKYWMPAECDVPLRQGWFFHVNEKPKSVDKLFELYLKSVGRGAGLDLGLAPDTRGQLHDDDVAELAKLGNILKHTFANNLAKTAKITAGNTRGKKFGTNWLTDANTSSYFATADNVNQATLSFNFKTPITFDLISIQEYIPLGQRIDEYTVEVMMDGKWQQIATGKSIGAKRLIRLEQAVSTNQVKVTVKAPVCVTLSEAGFYKIAD